MNSHASSNDGNALPSALDALLDQPLAQCPQERLPAMVSELLHQLVGSGLATLPLPGRGKTLERWRALAAVAGRDLSLAKLYEAHTDALAILAEAGQADQPPFSVWGVWCAEAPDAVLAAHRLPADDLLQLDGEKRWCSGAAAVTHALLSYRDADGRACLAALDLKQEGVTVIEDEWMAVGMAATRTARLRLDKAIARPVGAPGFYLERPGFWHGGAGIAACWHGAAAALADDMRRRLAQRRDSHALARLGSAECALAGAAACLRDAARRIDAHPGAAGQQSMRNALRARLTVERAALQVIADVGAALGPIPYCAQRRTARLLADLPVWLRQSHAERDLAALATLCTESEETPWQL
ncbi:acyl-CoA dehydrogenase [Herbaspirillum sp. WKF16]|uniref:acyl-CoA dehydrogenase n=1 Tax=Herbaspirillum sp. WKF16 TaxID=3028312 RepID=UPI0023A97338|nr:acyl-CoA dehydrogenase [Herbaspirillum sp. WKF16]WDZ97384.1 acyl-CoA dehydrogenase [Herbaspirillum sp. WKF16]